MNRIEQERAKQLEEARVAREKQEKNWEALRAERMKDESGSVCKDCKDDLFCSYHDGECEKRNKCVIEKPAKKDISKETK